jgi:hypothetical protein
MPSNLAPAAAGARSLHILDKTPFGEADRVSAGDYNVIKEANVDEAQGLLQALSDELVGLRRFCDSARVWVGEDHGRGVLLERFLDDFPRVYRCAVDRALEHFLIADEPMPFVEEDHGEDFSFKCAKFEGEVVASRSRTTEGCPSPYAKGHLLPGRSDDFVERCLANAGRGAAVFCVKGGSAHLRLRAGGIAR